VITEPSVVHLDEQPTAVVAAVIPVADVAAFFDRVFTVLPAALADQGVTPIGAAFARYRSMPSETLDVEAGFPVDRAIEPAGEVEPSTLPGGAVARTVLEGGFEGLGTAWQTLATWLGASGHRPATGGIWEVYLTEPTPDMDPADLRTELNWPLAAD
jgi:effector-binding domain-containing protein